MSTVFSSPKLANEVSTFVKILSILLTFLVFLSSIQSSSLFYYCMSIFPQSSISFIYMGAVEKGFFNSKAGVQLRQSSVMLTTHTIDEAENLCDKIAILVKGQIYCLGSPQELRIKYGDGYDIQLRKYKNRQEITQFLKKQFQNITKIEQKDQENLQFHIPSQSFDFYNTYFSLTELVQRKLIHDFSINQSSLESVFLQFSKTQNDQYN